MEMNTSHLKEKIQLTGGEDNDFLFTHLVLAEKEYEEIIQMMTLNELAEELDVSFISVERKGKLEFLHVTSAEHYDSIEKKGFVIQPNSYISDLGNGLYVIQKDDVEALMNLEDYISELYEDNEEDILLVYGTYKGAYMKCVYDRGHRGYIVLPSTESIIIQDMYEKTVSEFLRY